MHIGAAYHVLGLCARQQYHTRHLPLAPDVDLAVVAAETAAYVGADLAALARTAAMTAVRACAVAAMTAGAPRSTAPTPLSTRLANRAVTMAHFRAALAVTVPSTRRDAGVVTAALTSWDAVGGLDAVKLALRQAVEWPRRFPESFARLGLRPPRGILLHGPPGCAKTTLVRAAATAAGATFFALSGAQIYSPYVGEAERLLRETFKQARRAAPAILFLDEVDALVGKRALGDGGGGGDTSGGVQERVLSTLLNEMDGVEACAEVLVMAATNRPDLLDKAFLRPGRMDVLLFVPPPDEAGRLAILRVHARALPLAADVDLAALAAQTPRFTGADLQNLCREAAMHAVRAEGGVAAVTAAHFARVWAEARPSLSEGDVVDRLASQQSH